MNQVLCSIELKALKYNFGSSAIIKLRTNIKNLDFNYYITYNNNKAIIRANKAVASENAKPKIEYENN